MDFLEAKEEYTAALRLGQKEYKEMLADGKDPHPAVLDDLLDESVANVVNDIGLVEIPAERIIGTRSAGRITTFSPSFLPLAKPTSEFALKWINLCQAHLGEVGIRDPITCYEYLFPCCAISVRPGSPVWSSVFCPRAAMNPGFRLIMNFWSFIRIPSCMWCSSAGPVIMPGFWPDWART